MGDLVRLHWNVTLLKLRFQMDKFKAMSVRSRVMQGNVRHVRSRKLFLVFVGNIQRRFNALIKSFLRKVKLKDKKAWSLGLDFINVPMYVGGNSIVDCILAKNDATLRTWNLSAVPEPRKTSSSVHAGRPSLTISPRERLARIQSQYATNSARKGYRAVTFAKVHVTSVIALHVSSPQKQNVDAAKQNSISNVTKLEKRNFYAREYAHL